MKRVLRAALGGKRPAQSRKERKFRAQYHLVVLDRGGRWTGSLKRGKYNTINTYNGKTEQEVRDHATADVDRLWVRENLPPEKKIRRL